MKKILAMAVAAFTLTACNDGTDNATVETRDTTTMTTTNTANAYAPSEGDVTYRNNRVLVMRNGEWVETNEDVTLDNGVLVRRNGRAVRNNQEVEMEDGEVVTRSGNFFDRTGQAIEDGWDATKRGVKKAGQKIEDAVDRNN
jgi:predicted small secreted protein